jgi:hypothetical protein
MAEHRASEVVELERWICRSITNHEDVLGLDITVDDTVTLMPIRAEFIVNEPERLGHLVQ